MWRGRRVSVECLFRAGQCRSPSKEKEDFSALVSFPAGEGDRQRSQQFPQVLDGVKRQ